jgi:GMP synthase (glutamine-hydrolysing)
VAASSPAGPPSAASAPAARPVLVVDYGAQYAQLITRRVREAGHYAELVGHDEPVERLLARDPVAIVLSGGPASVYTEGAPALDEQVLEAGVPVLGICYGFQLMAAALGGTVERTGSAEYGGTSLEVTAADTALFDGLPARLSVWMSHGDAVTAAPPGFRITARTDSTPVAAFEDRGRRLAGVQFHPEVRHSEHGQDVIVRFLRDVAGLEPTWDASSIVAEQVAAVRALVGDGQAICGLSGGVDSAVAAALVQRAIGERFTCVFVDHGLLRAGEVEQVQRDFVASTGVRLITIDARERFLDALAGVRDPEEKRTIIGREFIRVFEVAAAGIVAEAGESGEDVAFLVQGTLYPDVVESGGGSGTATIKSHHNVGGLPDDLTFTLVEPLRWLFKDEVRAVGRELGLPDAIVQRQPFPGPGLAIRIVGAVDEERLTLLRAADAIAREELSAAGLDGEIWQCPVVLLADVRSVGVQGDGRTYGHPIVLRPVSSEDAMTADWSRLPYEVLARISSRITNELAGVNRVVLDITSKPPGTIEWE